MKNNTSSNTEAASFEAEGFGTFKFRIPLFIIPGKNGNQPIKAEDALKDSEILAYLVQNKSRVIEKVAEAEVKEEV